MAQIEAALSYLRNLCHLWMVLSRRSRSIPLCGLGALCGEWLLLRFDILRLLYPIPAGKSSKFRDKMGARVRFTGFPVRGCLSQSGVFAAHKEPNRRVFQEKIFQLFRPVVSKAIHHHDKKGPKRAFLITEKRAFFLARNPGPATAGKFQVSGPLVPGP